MKILYATDGSENAEAAAECLARLYKGTDHELTMLSVIDLPPLNYAMNKRALEKEYVNQQKELIEKDFNHAEEILFRPEHPIARKIPIGHIGQEIVQQAKSTDVDLIVVGAVGRSLIDRVLLGNVSEYVATHSHCSVLVVRPPRGGSAGPWLVASDGSEQVAKSLEEIAQAGFLEGRKARGIQIMTPPPAICTEADAQAIRKAISEETQENLSHLSLICEKHTIDWSQMTLESSHPGNAICETAEQYGSDFIVVGSTGKSLVARVLTGSVSRFVLRHAPCSVWIGRSKEG
ncbi:MAG: universal stress protein [Aureliella sp.]